MNNISDKKKAIAKETLRALSNFFGSKIGLYKFLSSKETFENNLFQNSKKVAEEGEKSVRLKSNKLISHTIKMYELDESDKKILDDLLELNIDKVFNMYLLMLNEKRKISTEDEAVIYVVEIVNKALEDTYDNKKFDLDNIINYLQKTVLDPSI